MHPAITAVLKIASWFFNPERWKVRREERRIREITKWENILAKALKENDTKMISIARYKLRKFREHN